MVDVTMFKAGDPQPTRTTIDTSEAALLTRTIVDMPRTESTTKPHHETSEEEAVAAYDAQDYRTAIKLFRRLATQGDALAQCRLGLMYYEGLGTKQNYDKAYAWVNLSATQGFYEAMEVRELLRELIPKVESRKPIYAGDPIIKEITAQNIAR